MIIYIILCLKTKCIDFRCLILSRLIWFSIRITFMRFIFLIIFVSILNNFLRLHSTFNFWIHLWLNFAFFHFNCIFRLIQPLFFCDWFSLKIILIQKLMNLMSLFFQYKIFPISFKLPWVFRAKLIIDILRIRKFLTV